jgi:hypothetical protein
MVRGQLAQHPRNYPHLHLNSHRKSDQGQGDNKAEQKGTGVATG